VVEQSRDREGAAKAPAAQGPLADARAPLADARAPLADARAPLVDARAPLADAQVPLADARGSVQRGKATPGVYLINRSAVSQRQIDATDRQIDQLVYELYELTDEEIKIVEEATTRGGPTR
jgi:hypothetical protein